VLSISVFSVLMPGTSGAQSLDNNTSLYTAPGPVAAPMSSPNIVPPVTPQPPRPKVRLGACPHSSGLACNASFCLKIHTTDWEQLPSDLTETPEVYVQFTRQIRDPDGQPLPASRFKVALAPGRNHARTLWFKMDGGPLFFDTRLIAHLTYPDALRNAAPFDLALTNIKVRYPLTGESCETTRWFLPSYW